MTDPRISICYKILATKLACPRLVFQIPTGAHIDSATSRLLAHGRSSIPPRLGSWDESPRNLCWASDP